MPPKRKHKAPTKPARATSQPKTQPAGGIRTSSIKRRKSSVQGGKSSTSRLQPSEPLHMTTRKARKVAPNPTSPAAPSVADGSSRRTSLNDIAQFEDDPSDAEDERPAKRSRVSTDSGSPPDQMGSFVSQTPTIETEGNTASRAAANVPKSAGKKRRASGDSSESSKTVSARPNGLLTRSESDLSEKQPRRKKRKTTTTPPDAAEAPPELTDASTPPGSPEAIPEVAAGQGLQNLLPSVNGELPAKAARRLPGRRRQPHSDINVEADLRRQLNIKMGYRSLAKLQKTFLEELSNRTTNDLENDPEFHQQGPEYDHLMAQLDARRESRLDQIHAERRLKLEQLERVREAEEHIQREQFINRFNELQDDFILQCLYGMKQLERRMKAELGDATDDEENVIESTHVEFPAQNIGDRLGSRYASRSRAYIETERMLEGDDVQGLLNQQRKRFMAENKEYDDSIENIPGGFAKFMGPDRADSLAHHKVATLVDAAAEVEKIPPQPDPPKIIPNEQADALFLLASLSAERPPEDISPKVEQHIVPPPQVSTPTQQTGQQKLTSPLAPLSTASTAMSLETVRSSPKKPLDPPKNASEATPQPEANGTSVKPDTDTPKTETPARLSTHKIIDILNDDQDVRLPKMREPQPPVHEHAPIGSPSRLENASQNQQQSQYEPHRMEAHVHSQEQPTHLHQVIPGDEQLATPRSGSPPASSQYWSSRNLSQQGEQANTGDTRHPLVRIREMLDKKAERNRRQEEVDRAARQRIEEDSARRESVDRAQMAPPLSRPYSPAGSERPNTGKESRRTSVSAYNASPATGALPYERSPRDQHTPYTQQQRQNSYDQGARSQWENGRRTSGSQGPPPPPRAQYTGSPAQQPYTPDYGRTGPTPPAHQSPYAPPSAPQLPSLSQPPPSNSLPPKPPAGPGQTHINYRFAHYDPAPPRAPFQQHVSYPAASHPPPPTGASLPQYSPPPYPGQPQYQGYIPPPGSFQAPPPPGPPNAMTPYPPLKIHQYGGQPILPANMAPPQSQGPMSPYPPAAPAPGPAYSPQGPPAPHPHFEHHAPAPPPSQERPDPQPRPRRQYRSYHAPGTEFRSYQGPNPRRRGG